MGRIKKRLLKRKAVKRVVRRKPQHPLQQTPEQKAKDVEMMKAMLMARPAAQIAGADKQQDQLLAKLDMLNKRYDDQVKAGTNLKAQIQQKDSLIQHIQAENAQLREEERQKQARNKLEEKQLKDKTKAEERMVKLDEAHEELQSKLDEFDEATEAGEQKVKLRGIRKKIKDKQTELDKKKKEIADNDNYAMYKEEEDKLEALQAQINAADQTINSEAFLNAHQKLTDAKAKTMIAQFELDNKKEVLKKQMEIASIQSDVAAQEQFMNHINAPQPKPILNKDGSIRKIKGVIQYEKDTDKNIILYDDYSIQQRLKDEMSDQMKAKYDAEAKRAELQSKIDATNDLRRRIVKGRADAEQEANEQKTMQEYIESDPYKEDLKRLHEEKAQLAQEEQQRQIEETRLETMKSVKRMQVENEMRKKYASKELDNEQLLTQIEHIGNETQEELERQARVQKGVTRHAELVDYFERACNECLSRYDGAETQSQARRMLERLIVDGFTNGDLGSNIHGFNNANLVKATDVAFMMAELDKNILLSNKKYNEFLETDYFNDFEWDYKAEKGVDDADA